MKFSTWNPGLETSYDSRMRKQIVNDASGSVLCKVGSAFFFFSLYAQQKTAPISLTTDGSSPLFFRGLPYSFPVPLFPRLRHHRNIAHAIEDNGGPVGIGFQRFPRGNAGEHQYGRHTALHTGYDVCVHPVAHHNGLVGVAVQQPQAGAHHQGVGLAAEICLCPGGHLNGGHQRPASGGEPVLNGTGDVGVGPDELRAAQHQIDGFCQRVEGIGAPLSHHHIIGIHVIHGHPRVIQGVEQPGLANRKYRAAGSLLLQKRCGGQGAGVEVLLRHVQAHAGQLLVKLPRRRAAVVGQEQVVLVLLMEPADKFLHPRQNSVAVVDHAVHIADKALFLVEIEYRSLFHRFTAFRCSS